MNSEEIIKRLLTDEQIIKKATEILGLTLNKGSFYYTSNLHVYKLTDPKFTDALEKAGFKITNRVADGILTLSDENPQPEKPGWAPSNYWNFHNSSEKQNALELELRLIPCMNYKERGVVFFPHVWGGYLSSSDALPCLRIFRVVAKYDKYAKTPIKQIAQNEKLIVSFKHIGLAGIRSLAALFEEFRHYNNKILQLAHSEMSPFNPNPSTSAMLLNAPEDIQALILQTWEIQLKEFVTKLEF